MTSQGDPFRTLGITAGASLNEIRSAYRRLAKQYHPDAAGERALPRFLAIQAAYEHLVDGEGRLRRGGTSAGRPGAEPADGGREPWRADPARARASRDAWRARRSAGRHGRAADDATDGAGHATGDAGGASSPDGGHARSRSGAAGRRTQDADGARAGQTDRTGSGDRTGRRTPRGPRKATPGSTTYDEAKETPLDPEWGGGAWYGPSSGTYWTINPREYADPRKHGPEYLARARRAAGDEAAAGNAPDLTDTPAMPGPSAEADATGERVEWRWEGTGRTTTARGEADWATGRWAYDPAGARADPAAGADRASAAEAGNRRRERPARPAAHAAATPGVADPSVAPDAADASDLEALARRASPGNLLAIGRRPDPRWRLLLALIGWPPIGFAVGTLLSTITGCASYSASCTDALPLLPIAVQPIVIAVLFLVVPVAATAAFASLVALAVALPVAAVLSVGTDPGSRVGAPVLGVAVALAYLAAVIAAVRGSRRTRPADDRLPP
jgi:curved DNA-binding protein CbpA